MSAISRVLKGTGIVAAAMAIARLGVLLNLALLARVLGAKDLGVYTTVWMTVGLFVTFSLFGLHTATARIVADYRARQPEATGRLVFNALALALTSSVVFAAAVTALVGPWAERFVHVSGFAGLVRLVVWTIPLMTLWQVGNAALQGLEDFRSHGGSLVGSAAVLVPVSYALAKADGLRGALWATIFTYALALLWMLWLLRRRLKGSALRLKFEISWRLLTELVRFSLPLLMASITLIPAWWLATLYLARLHGFTAVGFFTAGFAVFQILQFLPTALYIPAVPVLTGQFASQELRSFTDLLDQCFPLVWITSTALVGTLWLLAQPLAVFVFGAAFAGAAGVVRWMAIAGLFAAVSGVFGSALVSAGRVWVALWLNVCWFVLFLGFVAGFTPAAGADGVGLAACLSYLLFTLLVWWYCGSRFGVSFRRLPRLAVASTLVLVPAWLLSPLAAGLGRADSLVVAAISAPFGLWLTAKMALLREDRQRVEQWLWESLRGFSRA